MEAWFESAVANDESQLEELLEADPTLLGRVHPQHERTALQLAAAWDASRVVAFLLAYVTSAFPDELSLTPLTSVFKYL